MNKGAQSIKLIAHFPASPPVHLSELYKQVQAANPRTVETVPCRVFATTNAIN